MIALAPSGDRLTPPELECQLNNPRTRISSFLNLQMAHDAIFIFTFSPPVYKIKVMRQHCTYTQRLNLLNDPLKRSFDSLSFLMEVFAFPGVSSQPSVRPMYRTFECLQSFRKSFLISHRCACYLSEHFKFYNNRKKTKKQKQQSQLHCARWQGAELAAHNTTHSYTMELVMDSECSGKNCKQVERGESV